MEEITADTNGVLVYQEQIITLLQKVAGYTAGEADLVRKAIGKKIEALMRKEEPRFLAGCREKGLTDDQAATLWRLIQPFAGYSFNRAHAAGYGRSPGRRILKATTRGVMAALLTASGRQGRPPQVSVLPAHGHTCSPGRHEYDRTSHLTTARPSATR